MRKFVGQKTDKNIERYGTKNNTFKTFPVGTKVKIITAFEDFMYFYGETGTVIKNSGAYLGICVKYDEPRHFTDGHIQTDFNFNPVSLCVLDKEARRKSQEDEKKIFKEKLKKKLQEYNRQQSERFEIMDL